MLNLKNIKILRAILGGLGLLQLRRYLLRRAHERRQLPFVEEQRRRVAEFIGRYADTFRSIQTEPRSDANRVLVIADGAPGRVEMELVLVKALEVGGWRSMPLLLHVTNPSAYYSLLSATALHNFSDYFEPAVF